MPRASVERLDVARLPLGNVRRLGEVDPPEMTPDQAVAAREERVLALMRRHLTRVKRRGTRKVQ